jgi:hypothetical protein
VTNKMYADLAEWWPLLSPPEEYIDEANAYLQIFFSAASATLMPAAPTLLELGSGGGNNALYLKAQFASVTLADISPQMLAVSRVLNPDCEHIRGDMRTLRLGRTFDAVFIHDAIDYMTTLQDLRLVLETAFVHCAPGGIALLVPDFVRETFEPQTDHGGTEESDVSAGNSRGMRYLEWTYDPDPTDTTYTTDYAYLLREGNGETRVVHDRHVCGLFPREEWLRLLREVGFQPDITHDIYNRDLFIARRPA